MKRPLLFLLLFASVALAAGPGNRLVWTQIEWNGAWDPYPDLWGWASVFVRQTTRMDPWPERRTIPLSDERLFESPFVVVAGRGSFTLTEEDAGRMRDYLSAGGLLFFDDSEAAGASAFSRSVRDLPDRLFPGTRWRPIPRDHALYRSFFLLQGAAGRRRVDTELQGFWLEDRLVLIWSANDLLGALARDRLGQPLFSCDPGGEIQRQDSEKLFINILLFAVTGTYKTDAVHQPFLEKKGIP